MYLCVSEYLCLAVFAARCLSCFSKKRRSGTDKSGGRVNYHSRTPCPSSFSTFLPSLSPHGPKPKLLVKLFLLVFAKNSLESVVKLNSVLQFFDKTVLLQSSGNTAVKQQY